eukprot:Tbor_TRINITY_DN5556_c0_g1::TRINITY_DN5556_c0_g1_i6::g.13851::m.13851
MYHGKISSKTISPYDTLILNYHLSDEANKWLLICHVSKRKRIGHLQHNLPKWHRPRVPPPDIPVSGCKVYSNPQGFRRMESGYERDTSRGAKTYPSSAQSNYRGAGEASTEEGIITNIRFDRTVLATGRRGRRCASTPYVGHKGPRRVHDNFPSGENSQTTSTLSVSPHQRPQWR